jgi:hypothetical protein
MSREHVEYIHSPEVEPAPLVWPGWPSGATVKPLSVDEESGAQTSLVQMPAGYRRPVSLASAETEALVVSGRLIIGDAALPRLSYLYTPEGTAHEEWEAAEDTEVLYMTRTGPPSLEPADAASAGDAIIINGDELAWNPSKIANGPPGREHAILRRVADTGEMSWLSKETGAMDYPVFEYHECVEEVLLLEGWLTLENSATEGGEMWPGTYIWRPPYVTHGQAKSRDSMYFVYTDSQLVNRRTDGFHMTPEDNQRTLERELAADAS